MAVSKNWKDIEPLSPYETGDKVQVVVGIDVPTGPPGPTDAHKQEALTLGQQSIAHYYAKMPTQDMNLEAEIIEGPAVQARQYWTDGTKMSVLYLIS